MKITTLFTTPCNPGRFYTSRETILNTFKRLPEKAHAAVELSDGTFRLIDSDAIVAADREAVTLYEPVKFNAYGFPIIKGGSFFLKECETSEHARKITGDVGRGLPCYGALEHKAIPLPDGAYRRVREGDVVRLWEPPTVGKADASEQKVWGLCKRETVSSKPSWVQEAGYGGALRHSTVIGSDTLRFKSAAEAFHTRYKCPVLREFVVERMPDSAQPAPESVEKPKAGGGLSGIFTSAPVPAQQNKAFVVQGFGGPETSGGGASVVTAGDPAKIEPGHHNFTVDSVEWAPDGLHVKMTATKSGEPVTATPESQAGAEQDEWFCSNKLVSDFILRKRRENEDKPPEVKKTLEAAFARVFGPGIEREKQRQTKERLIQSRVERCDHQVKSILSLPAGPARAEAKLKLIGEISKL